MVRVFNTHLTMPACRLSKLISKHYYLHIYAHKRTVAQYGFVGYRNASIATVIISGTDKNFFKLTTSAQLSVSTSSIHWWRHISYIILLSPSCYLSYADIRLFDKSRVIHFI